MRFISFHIIRWGVVGSMFSLGALFSSQHLVFDLISHFRIQYIFLILTVLFFALLSKRYSMALVLTICVSVHIVDVYQSQRPHDGLVSGQKTALSIMSSNLLKSNQDYDSQVDYVKTINPDVIVFQEYTNNWDVALTESLAEYPFRLTVPKDRPTGIAVYSKFPMIEKEIVFLENKLKPSVEVTVSTGNNTLRILGTHPPPPLSFELYKERNLHLQQISARVITQTKPLVVVGDLNTSPWSQHFKFFLHTGGLYDGRRGHGLLPTWPAGFLPLQIPIDHIVANNAVTVVSMATSDNLNSDHRALWARLEF